MRSIHSYSSFWLLGVAAAGRLDAPSRSGARARAGSWPPRAPTRSSSCRLRDQVPSPIEGLTQTRLVLYSKPQAPSPASACGRRELTAQRKRSGVLGCRGRGRLGDLGERHRRVVVLGGAGPSGFPSLPGRVGVDQTSKGPLGGGGAAGRAAVAGGRADPAGGRLDS